MKQFYNAREWTRIWNFSIRDYAESPGEGGAQSSEIEVEVGATGGAREGAASNQKPRSGGSNTDDLVIRDFASKSVFG
jgi:hypothetical protein